MAVQLPNFPHFTSQIDKAIKDLGGRVIPKLNWSCPTDATWINGCGSLQCTNSEEVEPRWQLHHMSQQMFVSVVVSEMGDLCTTSSHWDMPAFCAHPIAFDRALEAF